MIIGTCRVDAEERAIKTSRYSYPLTKDTHVSVEPVFRTPAIFGAVAMALFGAGFHDLLYAGEIGVIVIAIFALLIAGFQFAQLHILDRVTRGTEQVIALSGLNYSLQKYRAEIDAVIADIKIGDA